MSDFFLKGVDVIGRTTVNDLANMLADKRNENFELQKEIQKLKEENKLLRECVEKIEITSRLREQSAVNLIARKILEEIDNKKE